MERYAFEGTPHEQKQALDALTRTRGAYPALDRIAQTHPAAWMRNEARRYVPALEVEMQLRRRAFR